MTTVLLVIHLMICIGLVALVLMQRSEGGALGIGGGGGGSFLTGRGTANLLTRATAVLAAAFFVTSILLTLAAKSTAPSRSVFDRAPATSTAPATPAPSGTVPATDQPATPATPPAEGARGGILDKLKRNPSGQ